MKKIISLILILCTLCSIAVMPVRAESYLSDESAKAFLKLISGNTTYNPKNDDMFFSLLTGRGGNDETKKALLIFAYSSINDNLYEQRLNSLQSLLESKLPETIKKGILDIVADEVKDNVIEAISSIDTGAINDIWSGCSIITATVLSVLMISRTQEMAYFASTIGMNQDDEYFDFISDAYIEVSESRKKLINQWTKLLYEFESSLTSQVVPNQSNSYKITFDSNCSDVSNYSYTYIPSERNWHEPAMSRNGYIFSGWYWDSDCTNSADGSITINRDLTFYAKWIDRYHTIKFDYNCSELNDYAYTYDILSNNWSEPESPTRNGYIFEGWYWDSAYTNKADGTFTLNKDLTFYAKWTPEFDFTISNNQVTITGINAYKVVNGVTITDIIIPETINGCSVTTIKLNAFYNNTKITAISIPNSVKTIESYAFADCSSLTNVTIPDSVTTIDDSAFENCDALVNITIPDGVTTIGVSAFNGCSSLANIYVSPSNIKYSSLDGVLFNKDKTELIRFPEGKSGEYSIPNGVISIGNYTFYNCANLTNIAIPDSVTSIGNFAFANCNNLANIPMPNGVTSIGNSAFYNCTNLTNIAIPNGVISIGNHAFYNCANLTNIAIPDSVTSIGTFAFYNCIRLTNVSLPGNIEKIHFLAFGCCENLSTVTFSNNTKQLQILSSFYRSPNISTVNITSIDMWCTIFFASEVSNPARVARSLYLNGKLLTDLIIPNNIATINNYSFYNCDSLTSATIPDSVTTIGEEAFNRCDNLSDIYYGGTKELWNNFNLQGIPSTCQIYPNCKYATETTKVMYDGTTMTAHITPNEEYLGCQVAIAMYKDNCFTGYTIATFDGERVEFSSKAPFDTIKVMLWSDLEDMTPLCNAEVTQISEW